MSFQWDASPKLRRRVQAKRDRLMRIKLSGPVRVLTREEIAAIYGADKVASKGDAGGSKEP